MKSQEFGNSHRALFLSALLLMGFSGIVAQVLLLRELLIVFSGNELTIGIILASWLILEAAGAFLLGRWIEHIRRKLEAPNEGSPVKANENASSRISNSR